MGLNMDKILDNLYLGSLLDACNQEELDHNQIIVVLNVSEFETKKHHIWCPLHDSNFTTKDMLIKAVDTLEELLASGKRVLIHCMMGMSRSASVVVLYIARTQKCSLKDAEQFVRERRPRIDIDDHLTVLAESILQTRSDK